MNIDSLFLLTIPIIAALVGWLTNKLAVYMTFYPVQYRGKRPFGWQGIIPAKAHKMASKAVLLITSRLLTVEEQFEKLDAHAIAQDMRPQLETLTKETVNAVFQKELPLLWRLIPEQRKQKIYHETAEQFPQLIEQLLLDVKDNLDELLDINKMMVEGLTENPEMLNRIFQKCGEAEFRFVERSGFVFGFLFGLIQMVVWNFYPFWWLLPAGGLVVGYLTNLLALKLIFRPVHPVKVGPFTIQGLFMKRQNEVSEEYARILANDLLKAEHIFEFILENNGMETIADIARRNIREAVDKTTGTTRRMLLELAVGSKKFERIKHQIAEMFVHVLPQSIQGMFQYADESLQIAETLESKLKSLTKEEFEDVLHPVFQEDEFTLVIVGAVLGGVAGVIQMAFIL